MSAADGIVAGVIVEVGIGVDARRAGARLADARLADGIRGWTRCASGLHLGVPGRLLRMMRLSI